MEVLMISFCLYLNFCGIELIVSVPKLILHYYIKITSLGNKHINTTVKYKAIISKTVQECLPFISVINLLLILNFFILTDRIKTMGFVC